MKMSLKNLFDGTTETAKQNLVRDGSVVPVVLLITGNKHNPQVGDIIPIQADSDDEKDQVMRGVQGLILRRGAFGYITISESWIIIKTTKDPPISVKPSKHPESKEALFVGLFTYDFHKAIAMIFERRGDKIVFTEEIPVAPKTELKGRFIEMLPTMNLNGGNLK